MNEAEPTVRGLADRAGSSLASAPPSRVQGDRKPAKRTVPKRIEKNSQKKIHTEVYFVGRKGGE